MRELILSPAERRQAAFAIFMAGALAFCVGLFAQSKAGPGSTPGAAGTSSDASGAAAADQTASSAGASLNSGDVFEGYASWYGAEFHGRTTSNGEVFDRNAYTAAHRTLPFGTMVLVTNLDNGASIVVRITDRGPFVKGRIIDLSEAAANILGMLPTGVAHVRCRVLHGEEAAAFGSPAPSLGRADGAAAGNAAAAAASNAASSGAAPAARLAHIQVASYSVRKNAEATADRLRASGLSPAIESAGGHYRVVFADVAEADVAALVQKLKNLGYRDPLIVYSGPAR